MKYCEISEQDFEELVSMGLSLWPHAKKDELAEEFGESILSLKHKIFLCKNDKNEPIAFIDVSLRSDYVEGSTSNPVGYVEGIYVKPGYRNRGVAKKLIKLAEDWAAKQGCKELASDAELDNIDSQKFHKKIGFKEANKIVCFIRKIGGSQNIT